MVREIRVAGTSVVAFLLYVIGSAIVEYFLDVHSNIQ